MENKIDESIIIDYLYGEISEEDEKKVELYLRDHPELKPQFDDLKTTRGLLSNIKDKEILTPSFLIEDNKYSYSTIINSNAFRWIASIAAGLILLLVTASLLRFNIVVIDKGVMIGFGDLNPIRDEYIDEKSMKKIITEVIKKYDSHTNDKIQTVESKLSAEMKIQDEQNLALLTNMMSKYANGTDQLMKGYVAQLNNENKEIIQNFFTVSTEKQKKYVKTVLADFNEFYQNQRNYDLRMIETSMDQLQSNQKVKQHKQDQLLASLYDMVKTQNK